MKKRNLLTLPLIALALIGCSKTGTSSNLSNSSTSADSSVTTNSQTTASSDSSNSVVSTTKDDASTSSDSSTSSTNTDDEKVDSGWSADIVDLMTKHLGGTILPKIDLGANSMIDGEWKLPSSYEYGSLTISGEKEWTSSSSNEIAVAYNDNTKWNIKTNNIESFVAESIDKKVKVTIGKMSEDDSTILITATYDEDYNLNNAATSWDSDVQDNMTDIFGEVTDYVYVGLAYPTCEGSDSTHSVTIYGGKWNDSILTDALSWKDKGFNVSINASSNQVIATKTSADGKSTYTYKIDQYGSTSYGLKIRLTISKKEVFDETSLDHWPDKIKNSFKANLNGHEDDVPYVYLGSSNPSFQLTNNSETIEIIGETWDDKILTNANTTYTSSTGWTVSDYDLYDETFIATKTFTDCSCVLTVTITHATSQSSSYDYPKMTVNIKKGMYIPSGADWTDETKKVLNDNFSDLELPYVYLNLKTSVDDTGYSEKATFSDSTITIVGGVMTESSKEKIIENMLAAYNADVDSTGASKWTVKQNTIPPYLTFEHTNSDGSIYQVNLTVTPNTTYDDDGNESSVNLATITVTKYAAYSVPEDASYGSLSDTFKTKFHNHDIPFVYLNTNYTNVYSYDDSIQIVGGRFYTEMITAAETSFKAGNWDTSVAKDGNSMTASIDEEDGCELTMSLSKDSTTGNAVMKITYSEPYFIDSQYRPSGWTTATTSAFTKNLKATDTTIFPYVYLGVNSEKTSKGSTTTTVKITGQTWSQQIIAEAKAAYEDKGWTVYDATYEGKSALVMTIKVGDNRYSAQLYRMNGKPQFNITYEKSAGSEDSSTKATYYPEATETSWNSSLNTMIKNQNHGYEIPFIDLGSDYDADTYAVDDVTESNYISIKSPTNIKYVSRMLKTYDSLKAWDADSSHTEKYNPYITIEGTKLAIHAKVEHADGSSTTITLNYKSGNLLEVTYNEPYASTETEWSSEVTRKFKKYFEGNVVPYINLGTTTPTVNVSNDGGEIDVIGGTWDDSIYDNAITAFTKDNWTYTYDYSDTSKGKTLVAYKEVSAGCYITCKLYKNSNGNPILESYYIA